MSVAEDLSVVVSSLPEDVRNRRLRRVDWRFLLPNPRPSKSVCFAGGELAESLRLVCDAVVRGGAADSRESDLAAASDPDARILAGAAESLRPGGFLFAEWRRRSPRPAAIRRRLAAAGFQDVRLFGPDRDPEVANPEAWLPLPWDGAARHFFVANRGRSRTIWRRAARRVTRSAALAARRARGPRPLCAIARKPGIDGDAPGGRDLSRLVLERWNASVLGPAPSGVSWLLLTGGLRSESKVIALAFGAGEAQPRLALKMPRTPDGSGAIEREAAVLRVVRDCLADMPAGVPRLVFLAEAGGLPVLAETAFSGVPLLSAWTEDTVEILAERASDWLVRLAGPARATPPEIWRAHLVQEPLAQFANAFAKALPGVALREAEELLGRLPALPIVCEQRDFSPWNVLLTSEGGLAVVDWESAEPEGLPALDLIYFLVNLAFSRDGARRTGLYRESYRALLDSTTRLGRLASRSVGAYFRRLHLPPAALSPLRLLAWVVHSRAEYERIRGDHGGAPGVDALRSAVCLQLFEEELRHATGGHRDWM